MEHHQFLWGKSTISMAMFNNYVSLPEGKLLGIRTVLRIYDGYIRIYLCLDGANINQHNKGGPSWREYAFFPYGQ